MGLSLLARIAGMLLVASTLVLGQPVRPANAPCVASTGPGIPAPIYDVDAPTPSGGPQEEFTVTGRTGAHTAGSMVPGRTYQVLVNVPWSFFVTGGEETHLFRPRVEPP